VTSSGGSETGRGPRQDREAERRPRRVVLSVDLEPNKDDTLGGVADAMAWFDRTVPRGTAFATYRIATELPDVIARLAETHGIGVHVHPREFGHDHDELARLPAARQRELVVRTREAVAEAAGLAPAAVDTFRAGRHSANGTTLSVLEELDFAVDASAHVRYDEYLPAAVTERTEPFALSEVSLPGRSDSDRDPSRDLVELPTSHARLPLASRCGLRGILEGPIPATAATLRADTWGCRGPRAVEAVFRSVRTGSLYMHPYDATDYHELRNAGDPFRERVESLVASLHETDTQFVTASTVRPDEYGRTNRRR
jgi:hypothetical protein